MSQWTHVAGVIRFDDLMNTSGRPDLGNTCNFDSSEEAWDRCSVPCGSEGSLQHSMWINPEPNHLAAYVCTFWGDLRDYSNEQEIVDYFKRITKGRLIRQGCFLIDVEYQFKKAYIFNDDKQEFEVLQEK